MQVRKYGVSRVPEEDVAHSFAIESSVLLGVCVLREEKYHSYATGF
jgi:hypothetical protein